MKEELIQLTFRIDEPQQLLRDAIRKYGISKKALTSIKYEGGKITVNGVEKTVRHKLDSGDMVQITFPPEKKSDGLIPQQVRFPILMEDNHLLILTKAAGISTIPSREHPTGTMANFLAGYLEESGLSSTVHIVTRLDKDTSGIICVAKHRHAHHLLSEMQKSGQISRTYEAIVHGHIQQDEFLIDAPIGRKNGSIIERVIDSEGKQAKTSVQVLSRFENIGEKLTHVRLQLHTGRTHQIRVHMMSIGHPLLGDDLYGGNLRLINRQALHARELTLVHPFTKEKVHLIAPFPEDLKELIPTISS
ncbi:RluA family pseudouridine synthase [Psychrobacillus psychrodurans]|uniref:RluA family pseudouridine synthase n=1 Tax=Psychrobacillus TaxID=1221880 RepID=UPI0008ED50A7|nr:RluA family pseudouridine synthase [Psychrobacillus psychrodurans]MCK1996386.1 RluA family pseudouridine synthase [Psychrobacillus psychrodurans]MCZ8539314.1 RluA family pseudouridine synthase [Psychrobacillus psychrodurans]SFM36254.1 23S rRNA pseudouridine1911/1915/1917 synthase [Psychrobacillus psychrodurans]